MNVQYLFTLFTNHLQHNLKILQLQKNAMCALWFNTLYMYISRLISYNLSWRYEIATDKLKAIRSVSFLNTCFYSIYNLVRSYMYIHVRVMNDLPH